MSLLNVKSVDELKSIGKFNEVKKELKKELEGFKGIKWNSWDNLFKGIEAYKNFNCKRKEDEKKENYFISKAAEYIFYLLELDGEARLEKLGITKMHFVSKDKAKNWRNNIAKIIHPDKCNHKMAREATAKLSKIYMELTGDEK